MNKSSQGQLLCVARIDLAYFGGPDDNGECLYADAVLAGPGGWAGLLEAAKLQEGDDRGCVGYILKAWASDAVSDALVGSEVWTDLCGDQVERVFECLQSPETGGPPRSANETDPGAG